MEFRATTADDLDRVLAVRCEEPVDWSDPELYRAWLAEGSYRPEWTWLALDGARVVGRAVWWGPADAEHPQLLDCLVVDPLVTDRVGIGHRLVAAGHAAFRAAGAPELPDFEQVLAPGFRAEPRLAAAVAWRDLAVRRAGLSERVERVAFEWTAGTALPQPSGDLSIEPERDDDVVLDALQWTAVGSLDVGTVRGLAQLGPEKQARDDLDFFYDSPGLRSWWRVAWTWHGRMAGLAIPARLPDGTPSVGHVAVLPEYRGRHVVDDLLEHVTRHHAESGARRVVALTETTNVPMVAALVRCGYRRTGIRAVFSAPQS